MARAVARAGGRGLIAEGVLRAVVVVAVLALVAAVAWARRRRGHAHDWAPSVPALDARDVPGGLAAPLTAVYFTSPLCAACRETPRVVLEAAPELRAVAVSVRDRPDLTRRLGVQETPTLLLVDARGRIRYAVAGNPEPAELWTYAREAWDSLEVEGALARHPADD